MAPPRCTPSRAARVLTDRLRQRQPLQVGAPAQAAERGGRCDVAHAQVARGVEVVHGAGARGEEHRHAGLDCAIGSGWGVGRGGWGRFLTS
jgi:hypothetical protein